MPIPSVVLDTNILVSANLNPHGLEQSIYSLALNQYFHLFVSEPILVEYEAVLRRPKFRFPPERVAESLALIRQNCTLVEPATILAVSPDERDNRFLECAEAANANFLVTGNRRHFPGLWNNTRIVSSRELIGEVFSV
jgi:putative PIN family toxin of toxin-antitoxin system